MLQVREKKGRLKVSLPKATISIIALNIILYFLFSSPSSFFVLSSSFLGSLSLQAAKPLSLLTHMFIHLWPSHLAVDCFLLIFFGWIVEREVGGWKTLGVYLASGAVAGAVHLLFSPATKLIGSSGAVFGMVGAAVVVAPVSAFAAFVLLAYGASPLLASEIDSYGSKVGETVEEESKQLAGDYRNISIRETGLKEEVAARNETLSSIAESVGEVEEQIGQLEEQREEIGEEKYLEQAQQLEAEKAELEAARGETESELEEKSGELQQVVSEKEEVSDKFETSRKKASDYRTFKTLKSVTTESEAVHLAGLFTGYLLLVTIEPGALGRKNVFLSYLRRRRKKR